MAEITVDKALRVWRHKYGVDTPGNYGKTFKKLPLSRQRWLIIVFLRWMKMSGYGEDRFTSTSFANELAETWCGSAPWANKERKKNAEQAVRNELLDILMVEEVFTGKRRRKNKAKAEANAKAAKKAEDDAKVAREVQAAKEAEVRPARPIPKQEEPKPTVRPDATETPYDSEEEDTVPDEEFLNELKEAAND
jgi:hypothetical protein